MLSGQLTEKYILRRQAIEDRAKLICHSLWLNVKRREIKISLSNCFPVSQLSLWPKIETMWKTKIALLEKLASRMLCYDNPTSPRYCKNYVFMLGQRRRRCQSRKRITRYLANLWHLCQARVNDPWLLVIFSGLVTKFIHGHAMIAKELEKSK